MLGPVDVESIAFRVDSGILSRTPRSLRPGFCVPEPAGLLCHRLESMSEFENHDSQPQAEERGEPRFEPARVECAGGTVLAGWWVLPSGGGPARKAVALHPATGVDMHLYRKFAVFLAERGWAGLIYDFRGTGDSATPGDSA